GRPRILAVQCGEHPPCVSVPAEADTGQSDVRLQQHQRDLGDPAGHRPVDVPDRPTPVVHRRQGAVTGDAHGAALLPSGIETGRRRSALWYRPVTRLITYDTSGDDNTGYAEPIGPRRSESASR